MLAACLDTSVPVMPMAMPAEHDRDGRGGIGGGRGGIGVGGEAQEVGGESIRERQDVRRRGLKT